MVDVTEWIELAPGLKVDADASYERRAEYLLKKAKELGHGRTTKGYKYDECRVTQAGIESLLGAGAQIVELNDDHCHLGEKVHGRRSYYHAVLFDGHTFVAETAIPVACHVEGSNRRFGPYTWQEPVSAGTSPNTNVYGNYQERALRRGIPKPFLRPEILEELEGRTLSNTTTARK